MDLESFKNERTSVLPSLRSSLRLAQQIEESLEQQLARYAAFPGDDEEVQRLFAYGCEQARENVQALVSRLAQLDGLPAHDDVQASTLAGVASALDHSGHVTEEQTLQNLVAAYTAVSAQLGGYKLLGLMASAAADALTVSLAAQLQSNKQSVAERIFHFIPSRAKIAFNMLTPSEIDPAVETRAADDRLLES